MDLLVLLIIAGIALMVLAKLYSVLGKDVGAPPPQSPKLSLVPDRPQSKEAVQKASISFSGLASLQKAAPKFDPAEFVSGAASAYEMIVTAFAAGDRDTLQPLLSKQVYANYDEAISVREAANTQQTTDIVRMDEPKIIKAKVKDNIAQITVEFHSDLSMLELDEEGKALNDADDTGPAEVTEQWTFEKNLKSRDPNWVLSAVSAIA